MLNLHDARAPELYPHTRFTTSRYCGIVARGHELLRCAEGWEPLILTLPLNANATMAVRAIYEARLSVPPGSYLVGFSGTFTAGTAGFEVVIRDLRDQSLLTSRPVNQSNITGQPPAGGIPPPVYYLPEPRLIIEPGLVSVRIRNLDALLANTVQLCTFWEVPCKT